ncbi:MAG: FHA domain-containing protein [Fimbriimonadales bacterium]|nr:FHA domain-containing protein [Fimbriimonadales bacterium]MDW8051599.1 FHA domain-containing protein [Armatimonadota bacterium]
MVTKLIYLMLFGAVGGLLGWSVLEPFYDDTLRRSVDWGRLVLFGAVAGGFIGAMIGLASGLSLGTGKHIARGTALGALVGIVGGWIGVTVGQIIFGVLIQGLPVVGLIIGRILGWMAFGAAIGFAEGVVARSPKRMRNGALGGAIGGGLGGALFDMLGLMMASGLAFIPGTEHDAGAPSRAVGLTLIGAGIGLFIGLLELLTRSVWVRVLYGRNEYKEYPIDRDGAYLGRDELADVPLRGDPQVAPRHAEIRMAGGSYTLVPLAPLLVNGQTITTPTLLNDGDMLQIGQFQLQFLLREGQAQYAPRDVARPSLTPLPTRPGTCPYCGQPQDPLTGACACTPTTTPSPTPTPPPAPTPTTYAPFPAATAGVVVVAPATQLVGLDGALAGQRFTVPPAGLTIGRETDNALVIPDPTVSRHHARIAIENGTLVVYDLNSTNGTYVNEQRISRQPLKAGDLVRFGNVRFRVE